MCPSAEITPANESHLPAISALASVIWRECYPSIITTEQIEYMLARMYSLETLTAELRGGIRYERLLLDALSPLSLPSALRLSTIN